MDSCIQFLNQVGASYFHQFTFYVAPLFRLVPEEELSLCQFFALGLCGVDGLQGIWVKSCVPRLRAYGHWRRCEVLHLFEVKIKLLCGYGKFSHVLFAASRVAAYKIRYDLLTQAFTFVYLVKYNLELFEKAKRRLAHQPQYIVGCMFGSNL